MKRLKLPSVIENLGFFIDFFKSFAKEYGITESCIQDIEFSCEEIIVNIIGYAYSDETGDIEVTCENIDGKSLKIEIIDWGSPFDILQAPKPDINENIEDRKLGFLTRQLMDEVLYKREKGMNITTLIKHFSLQQELL